MTKIYQLLLLVSVIITCCFQEQQSMVSAGEEVAADGGGGDINGADDDNSDADDTVLWQCDEMAPPTCDLDVTTDIIETPEGLHMQYWIYSPVAATNEITANSADELGPPLIILQGGPGLPHNYDLMLRVLACPHPTKAAAGGEEEGDGGGSSGLGRKVIFYDPVGIGVGSAIPNNTSIEDDYPFLLDIKYRAMEVKMLIDTVLPNDEPYHIIGDSCGTQTAMEYATSTIGSSDVNSGRLVSLVMNGPIPNMVDYYEFQTDEIDGTIGRMPHYFQRRWKELIESGDYMGSEFQTMDGILNGLWNYRSGIVPDCTLPSFININLDIYVGMFGISEFLPPTGTLKDFDMYPHLHKLDTIPILLTSGEYDMIRPKTIEKMKNVLPLSETQLLKDSGHSSLGDVTQDLLNTVSNFIHRVEKSAELGKPFVPMINRNDKDNASTINNSVVSVFTVNIVLTVLVSIGIGYILGSQHQKLMTKGGYEPIE